MKEKTLSEKRRGLKEEMLNSITTQDERVVINASFLSIKEQDKQFIKEVLEEIERIEKLGTLDMMTETFKLRNFIKQKAGGLADE